MPLRVPEPGIVNCLGAGAINKPHKFYSEDRKCIRKCPKCKKLEADMNLSKVESEGEGGVYDGIKHGRKGGAREE